MSAFSCTSGQQYTIRDGSHLTSSTTSPHATYVRHDKGLVSELRAASPSVARLADLAVWREREAFEEKQNRALALLRKKDAKIRELSEAVARRRNASRQRAAADGRETATAAAGVVRLGTAGAGGGGGGGEGGRRKDGDNAAAAVERLEQCVEEQADQIEALLREARRGLWEVRVGCFITWSGCFSREPLRLGGELRSYIDR